MPVTRGSRKRILKLIQQSEEMHRHCMETNCTCTCKACARRRLSVAVARLS